MKSYNLKVEINRRDQVLKKDLDLIYGALSGNGAEISIRESNNSILIAFLDILEFIYQYRKTFQCTTISKLKNIQLHVTTFEPLNVKIVSSCLSEYYYFIINNSGILVKHDDIYHHIDKIYDILIKSYSKGINL